jgi:hypothetical protein
MKYCQSCGGELAPRKTKSSWEEINDCTKCNLRYHTILGDRMGGCNDTIDVYPISEDNQ